MKKCCSSSESLKCLLGSKICVLWLLSELNYERCLAVPEVPWKLKALLRKPSNLLVNSVDIVNKVPRGGGTTSIKGIEKLVNFIRKSFNKQDIDYFQARNHYQKQESIRSKSWSSSDLKGAFVSSPANVLWVLRSRTTEPQRYKSSGDLSNCWMKLQAGCSSCRKPHQPLSWSNHISVGSVQLIQVAPSTFCCSK